MNAFRQTLDSVARLNDFSKDPEDCNSKFPVASDADGRIAKSYDLIVKDARAGAKDSRGTEIDHGFAERTTFIVTPDGKVAAGSEREGDEGTGGLNSIARSSVTAKNLSQDPAEPGP
jgi:alkyl hydroperoxide reductase subunit AhpC